MTTDEEYETTDPEIDDIDLGGVEKGEKEIPANDLDFNYQLIQPTWQDLPLALRKKLIKKKGEKFLTYIDKETNKEIKTKQEIFEELSGILQIYTKDIRLGNLSTMTGEYDYVIYYLELAPRFLLKGYVKSCITALNKALSHLETSNSKSAKLRELMQTIIHKTQGGSEEPEKKSPLKTQR